MKKLTDKEIVQAAINYSAGRRDPVIKRGAFKAGFKAALSQMEETDWVSVDERLPTKTDNYLIFNPNSPLVEKREVARFDNYNKKWFQDSDEIHPTFWRPLPAPPKEG
jgi:hypothetical protein